MNKSISLNKGLQDSVIIKDDITTDGKNKNSMRSKLMNDFDGNYKNRNFLRKQVIKENNSNKKFQIEKECLPENCFKNNIFQYYYSTIEFLKKYYFNSYINNNISKNKKSNIFKNNNYYFCDKNLYNVSYINTLNANFTISMKNNIFINNYKDKKSNFIYNYKKENDKNKTSESNRKLINEEKGKIDASPKTEININNLNSNFESNSKSNNNEFKNLIVNINCPSFKPSNFNNKETKNITSESNTISNNVENRNRDKENDLTEDEYSIKMFGKNGWICVLCNNFNYQARVRCNRCKSLKNPKKIVNTKSKIKNDFNSNNDVKDWICSKCQNLNYSFRTICNRCKEAKIVKPVFYQNFIYNNIIRYSPKLTPSYIILNNTPNIYLNKIAS